MLQETNDLVDRLFDPVPFGGFVSEHWGRRALSIVGTSGKFSCLYDLSSFQSQLLGDIEPTKPRRPPPALKAVFSRGGGGSIVHPSLNTAMTLFDAGMTLCASNLELHDQRLSSLVEAMRKRLQFVGQIQMNGYYSPDNEGFSWHYDCSHVFILQIEGSKRWQYCKEPSVEAPLLNVPYSSIVAAVAQGSVNSSGQEITLPTDETTIETVLRAGDMLYLPPGTWHRAFACSHSLGLSLTLHPTTFVQMVLTVLGGLALSRGEWRRDINTLRLDMSAPLEACVAPSLERNLEDCLAVLRAMRAPDFFQLFEQIECAASSQSPLSNAQPSRADS